VKSSKVQGAGAGWGENGQRRKSLPSVYNPTFFLQIYELANNVVVLFHYFFICQNYNQQNYRSHTWMGMNRTILAISGYHHVLFWLVLLDMRIAIAKQSGHHFSFYKNHCCSFFPSSVVPACIINSGKNATFSWHWPATIVYFFTFLKMPTLILITYSFTHVRQQKCIMEADEQWIVF
jgi:hypothetical protein